MPTVMPLETAIVAVPETAGSALSGMVDVLSATGNVWQTLMRTMPTTAPFRVRVVSTNRAVQYGRCRAFRASGLPIRV